ncbi:Fic family protein [Mycobacterium sp. SMC-4]|uniref:Fic family protein n=1 Tax=Mycobacterium sp. SMC-4 TaxID=2857059 RepID=UPI0021B3EE0C|nr:Fic family protein [Mycobacterium sp. SMC-4]UXA16518.1 Fic family protein [Mycobacterium sp. SMC-4]
MLDGSPYSLSDDRDAASEIVRLIDIQRDLSRRLTLVITELRKAKLFIEQKRNIRTTEVYESNALEGVGTDLPGTYSILTSPLADDAIAVVKKGMLLSSLTSERKVLDVVGLNAARDLAQRIAERASSRLLSQADIRTLHSMIETGTYAAGAYRTGDVAIEGSRHRPPDALEVPRLMSDLVDWCESKRDCMPAVLHAAVIHGWLTHIHPFNDGNGRTARVVVNMLMSQLGLPPVIVRHGADRGTYLDALALSDDGGDILPFAGVFVRAQKRLMRQMEKPAFLRQIFNDEVKRRGNSMYEFWLRVFSDFIESLVAGLSVYGIRVEQVGQVDRTSYELLREGDSTGNMWLLRLTNQEGCELLIWLGYSSWRTARAIPGPKREPAMYFSVRSQRDRTEPYRRTSESELGGLGEVVIVPDISSRVYAAVPALKKGGISDSADYIAEKIGQAFSRGEIPK